MTDSFHIIKASTDDAPASAAAPVRLDLRPRDAASPFGQYLLSDEIATAVNVSLALGQPLLVTGEPGCGKTALAWAVAAQLGTDVLEFHTKSTSVARDLFYVVDTLRRFHDASAHLEEARDASRYLKYQALGEAIRSRRTRVVLIDEIDKAPRDFPNDLLNELDRMEFSVPELTPPVRHQAQVQHFVLITSNSERRLPPPFLRRCTYLHLPFPEPELLARIVAAHTRDLELASSFIALAVERFGQLRRLEDLSKPPSTGELIAWVRVLARLGQDQEELASAPLGELPALETLLKTHEDHKRMAENDRT